MVDPAIREDSRSTACVLAEDDDPIKSRTASIAFIARPEAIRKRPPLGQMTSPAENVEVVGLINTTSFSMAIAAETACRPTRRLLGPAA